MNSHRKIIFLVVLISLFGFWLRYTYIWPANIVFDYDQYEDLFYTKSIAVDHNLAIIGRPIYGNPNIHHGVFFFYYNLIPFVLFGHNPVLIALWNSAINALSALLIYFLSKSIFKKQLPAIISAIFVAISFEYIKYSGWLSNPTTTLITIPLFFLGLWKFYEKRDWGLILASTALGIAIQSELFLLYLVPTFLIFWLVFRPNIPTRKTIALSLTALVVTLLPSILTEIRLGFAGINALFHFSQTFDAARVPYSLRVRLFSHDFFSNFASNLLPTQPEYGIYIAAVILAICALSFIRANNKTERRGIIFCLIYLLSPVITLLLGYHNKPWFFVSLPPAISLISGYAVWKLRYWPVIVLTLASVLQSNIKMVLVTKPPAYSLFKNEYSESSLLSSQIAVMDYTYKESSMLPFSINSVTYPLYHNALWEYNYDWYGKSKYGYVPDWLGGNQPPPYSILKKINEPKGIFYLIIDDTARIRAGHKQAGKTWAGENGKLIEEKQFQGFIVQKRERSEVGKP